MTAWVAHSHAPGGSGVKSSELGSCWSAEGRPPPIWLTFTAHPSPREATLTENYSLHVAAHSTLAFS